MSRSLYAQTSGTRLVRRKHLDRAGAADPAAWTWNRFRWSPDICSPACLLGVSTWPVTVGIFSYYFLSEGLLDEFEFTFDAQILRRKQAGGCSRSAAWCARPFRGWKLSNGHNMSVVELVCLASPSGRVIFSHKRPGTLLKKTAKRPPVTSQVETPSGPTGLQWQDRDWKYP
jgi:hypothetical protein